MGYEAAAATGVLSVALLVSIVGAPSVDRRRVVVKLLNFTVAVVVVVVVAAVENARMVLVLILILETTTLLLPNVGAKAKARAVGAVRS